MTRDLKFLPVSHPYGAHRFIAFLTAIIFTFSVLVWSPTGLEANAPAPLQMGGSFEVLPLSHFEWISKTAVSIPAELGTIEYSGQGKGPSIFHIQTAHGHYEAQKQIQSILHHLDKNYGVKTLLVEGSAFELKPELIQFFRRDNDLTMRAADRLTREAILKGAELYLLESEGSVAYGIEELNLYRENGRAFARVLQASEKSKKFLSDMDSGIERLASHYLNKDLRNFIKRFDSVGNDSNPRYENRMVFLKEEAVRHLGIDLADTGYQIDWPMLVRFFKLRELSKNIDQDALSKEKPLFLKSIHNISAEYFSKIESVLTRPDIFSRSPDSETDSLFLDMIHQLPSDFSYKAFPNINRAISCLLLRNEINGPVLAQEERSLAQKVVFKLVADEKEKQLIELLEDYRLLRRLFALELLPEDYEMILSRRDSLRPSAILPRFLAINDQYRVKNISFGHIPQIDSLFDLAMDFYKGVKERDLAMERRIEERLKTSRADRVAVITGGFHAAPFREHFSRKGFGYALITPRLSGTDEEGHHAYVKNALRFSSDVLEAATRESEYISDAQVLAGNAYGINAAALRSEIRKVVADVGAELRQPKEAALRSADQIKKEPVAAHSKIPATEPVIERFKPVIGRIGMILSAAAVFGILTVLNARATDYQITPTPGLTQTNLTNPQIETVQPIGPAIVPVISKNEVQVSSNMGSDTNTIKGLVMALSSPQNFSGTNIVFGFSRQFAGNTASIRLKDAAGRTSTNRVRMINVNSSSQFYQVAASKFEGGLDLTKITEMTVLFDQPLDPQVLFASWNILLGGIGQLPSCVTKIRDLGVGGIELTFITQIGGSYEAEQSSDLRSSSWSTVPGTAVNPSATEATVIIPKTTNPQFMRIRTNPRSELRLTVAEERQDSLSAGTFVANIPFEERILIREYYPGILMLSVYEAAMRNGRAFAVNTASMILERPVYAEGIAFPMETKALSLASRPESFKNFPAFGLAQGILLATETGKIADGLILSRKFAFDRRGAIAAARTVLGDVPLAVIVPINNGKEIAFIRDLNVQLAKANRPEIFLAHTAEAALRYLRSKKATRLKALFDESEKSDPLAVALRNQLPEIAFVNDEMFRSFMGYAGMEIERLVVEVQAQFAFARAA